MCLFIFEEFLFLFFINHPNRNEVISQSSYTLTICDAKYISMYLLAICISSLEKYFNYFAHFENGLITFLF